MNSSVFQFLPKNIDVRLCSVIDFAFMKVNLRTHKLEGRPGNKDDEMIKELLLLKKKKPSLKVFVSVGEYLIFLKPSLKIFLEKIRSITDPE